MNIRVALQRGRGRPKKSGGLSQESGHRRCRAMALIDCLIYLVLMVLLFGMTVLAFLETLRHSTELDRVTVTTVRALQTGEQWREDIRAGRGLPQMVELEGRTELRLATATGEIGYAVQDGVVFRRPAPTAPWVEVLNSVKVSRFRPDRRTRVTAWRWEIELDQRRENQRLRRVFSFNAVPGLNVNR